MKRRPIPPCKIGRNDDVGSVEYKLIMERLVQFDKANAVEGEISWKSELKQGK